jgi:hypothetical protein
LRCRLGWNDGWHFDWRVGIGSGFVKPRWRRPLPPVFFSFVDSFDGSWLGAAITLAFVCVQNWETTDSWQPLSPKRCPSAAPIIHRMSSVIPQFSPIFPEK